jgi:hypothetical protein
MFNKTIIFDDASLHMDEFLNFIELCKLMQCNSFLFEQYIKEYYDIPPIKVNFKNVSKEKQMYYIWNYGSSKINQYLNYKLNELKLEVGKVIKGFISVEEFDSFESNKLVFYHGENGKVIYIYTYMNNKKSLELANIREFLEHIERHNEIVSNIKDPMEAYSAYLKTLEPSKSAKF